MSELPPFIRDVCKIGQNAECCRFLVCGAEGFECAKHTGLRAVLDYRVKRGLMVARGDNCEGKPEGEIIG